MRHTSNDPPAPRALLRIGFSISVGWIVATLMYIMRFGIVHPDLFRVRILNSHLIFFYSFFIYPALAAYYLSSDTWFGKEDAK